MSYPEYVSVDTNDGTVFYRDYDHSLFDLGGVVAFTEARNGVLLNPTYKIYQLTEVTEEDIISAAEQQNESRYGGDGVFADNE